MTLAINDPPPRAPVVCKDPFPGAWTSIPRVFHTPWTYTTFNNTITSAVRGDRYVRTHLSTRTDITASSVQIRESSDVRNDLNDGKCEDITCSSSPPEKRLRTRYLLTYNEDVPCEQLVLMQSDLKQGYTQHVG
jgi:hypothetical protein